jgi:hypothetical protein
MIDFYINGEKTDIQLEDEKTVGDVLNSFEQTCEANQAAVIGIVIDDKQITADLIDKINPQPIEEHKKFEFSVITVAAIKDAFEKLTKLFDLLIEKVSEIPVELQNGNATQFGQTVKNLADGIDQFCHVAALASLFPEEFNETKIDGQNLQTFLAEFSPVLSDFEEGLKNNDTVLISDLAEYEICPRLKSVSESLKKIIKS